MLQQDYHTRISLSSRGRPCACPTTIIINYFGHPQGVPLRFFNYDTDFVRGMSCENKYKKKAVRMNRLFLLYIHVKMPTRLCLCCRRDQIVSGR